MREHSGLRSCAALLAITGAVIASGMVRAEGLFPSPVMDAGLFTVSVAVGDFDGNGTLDLAVANRGSDDVSVLLGFGDGTFAAEQRFAAGNGPRSVAVGDFDGNGTLDLAVANLFSDDVSVLLNQSPATECARLGDTLTIGALDVDEGIVFSQIELSWDQEVVPAILVDP